MCNVISVLVSSTATDSTPNGNGKCWQWQWCWNIYGDVIVGLVLDPSNSPSLEISKEDTIILLYRQCISCPGEKGGILLERRIIAITV